MNRELYLGSCQYDPPTGRTFTRIGVLARAEAGAWQLDDFAQTLPPEGCVFAPNLPTVREGDCVAFHVVQNERLEPGKDEWLVGETVPVAEVLDYRDRDPETARVKLVEEGVKGLFPGTREIIVALPEGVCVVLPMVQHPHEDLFSANRSELQMLQTFALDDRLFEGEKIQGAWLNVPQYTVGRPVSTVDWRSDADFLSWVLRRLRKVQKGSPVSRRQVAPLVRYLQDARLIAAPGEVLSVSALRLERLVPQLAANHSALEEIVGILSALEPVEDGIEARRKQAKDELKTELQSTVRKELEEGLTDLTTRRDGLRKEITSLIGSVKAEERRAVAAEKAARRLEVALADELAAVGEVLEGADGAALSKASDLAKRLAGRLSEVDTPLELAPGPMAPWSRSVGSRGAPTSWSDAANSLRATAERYGYDPEEMRVADVAVRAGLVLILPEESAADFVRCYASAVAGGVATVEALHPAVIALDDLWRQPATGIPTGFAEVWTAARLDPHRYRVILLDGLQRAPNDLWARSLADVLAGPARPTNLLVFASLGKGFVDPERVWTGLEKAFVAFVPASPTGPTVQLLERAARVPEVTCWLDHKVAPRPGRVEIAAHLDQTVGESDPRLIARSLALFVAGCAVQPTDAASEMAVEFLASGFTSLERGADWVKETLVSG